MAFTGQLGTSSSILGESFALGFSESDPTNQITTQSFGFIAAAEYDPVFNALASQRMLVQTLTSNYHVASNSMFAGAESNLAGFGQTIDVKQFLGFTTRFFAPDVGNILGLNAGQRAAEAKDVDASNHFFTSPDNDNVVVLAHLAPNAIGFVDTIASFTPEDAENTLTLTEDLTASGSFDRTFGETGILKQHATFSISNAPCQEREYAPNIGESDSTEFEELQSAPPPLTRSDLTLFYPPDNPTLTLDLTNPEFQNADVRTFTRLDRTTRGGERKIFSDPKWAQWERLEFTSTGICEETADQIITFLNTSLGREIKLLDWEGRTWKGFITEPNTDVEEDAQGFTVRLTFEGRVTTLNVEHEGHIVIHGQDANGNDVLVIYND